MTGLISQRNVFNRLGISLFLFLFMAACSRAPKGIIPERKMMQILTDMHIAEAIIETDRYDYSTKEEREALYQSVFDKHRVTEAMYDSSLIWYGKNLHVYMQVYNMALADVNKRIEKINVMETESVNTSSEDSLNIWSIGRYHEFYPASLSNTLIFNFQPDEEYSSGSVFVLSLHVRGLASGLQQPVEAFLCAEQRDTTLILKSRIHNDGYHEMILRSLPTRRVGRVYGYIRLNERTTPYHKIYLDDLRMKRYRYGSEEIANTL